MLLVAACAGVSTATQLTERSERCDYAGKNGMCIIFEDGARRLNGAAMEAAYLQAKQDIEERYGLDLQDLRGPVVHVMRVPAFATLHPVKNRVDGDTGGDHGWTDFGTGEIALTGPAVMRHESFHYLLWASGYSNALNAVHEHPAFDEYRDGQWLPRRTHARADNVAAPVKTAAPANQ